MKTSWWKPSPLKEAHARGRDNISTQEARENEEKPGLFLLRLFLARTNPSVPGELP
jgi:hypothetical protein